MAARPVSSGVVRGTRGLAVHHLPAALSQLAGAELDWQTTMSQETEAPSTSSQKSYHKTQNTHLTFCEYISIFAKLQTKPWCIWLVLISQPIACLGQIGLFYVKMYSWLAEIGVMKTSSLFRQSNWRWWHPVKHSKLFFCTRSHCRSLQPWWRVRASLVHCVGFYAPYMLCFGQGLWGWLTHTYIYIWVTLLVKARLIHSIYCRSSYQFLTLLWMWLCSPQACKKSRCLV